MIKPGVNIIKLVLLSFVVIFLVKCDKNTPCDVSMSDRFLHCIIDSPGDGAIVNPTNLTLRWTVHDNSTSSLYFGINREKLPLISKQSATSFILNNLDLNTTYYWYVIDEYECHNNCSTSTQSFTTVPDINLPYVTTAPVFTHINTPPRVGGNVIYEGSSKLSEHGIYFGLSHNPEIGGTKFQIDNGAGLFSDLLSGLNTGTIYYVKAYATNNSGTVFGAEVSFTTGQVSNYNSIRDIDGNMYYIINIGNQVWMAENLRTTRFNDGTLIPNISDDSWGDLNIPGYCWYNNNPGFKSTYGALYNWYTVDSISNGLKNVCPSGWHVPDDTEWTMLITFLGGEAGAGTKLKETGDYYWSPSASMGDNSSDFSALAGGQRIDFRPASFNGSSGLFYDIGYLSTFWSNTFNTDNHWLQVRSDVSGAEKHLSKKNSGNSIRCIKNSK
jgi:Fibrobacter succinogenes major domain (Fib_succ_major).